MSIILLIGRFLFSAIFIVKAFHHFSPQAMEHATGMGVPLPILFVPLSGVLSLAGGLSILLGYKAKIGAWLLIVFLLPITLWMHQYWHAETPFAAMMHQYCFLKNLSMIGACCMIAYFGSGPFSLSK